MEENQAASAPTAPDFKVAQIVATSIDALLSAASLNLGEPLADGSRLAEPDPVEAYLATMAAHTLIERMGPLMTDTVRMPFEAAIARLAKLFAEKHPHQPVPKMNEPVSNLRSMVEAAWVELAKPKTETGVRSGTGSLPNGPLTRPGTGSLGRPGTGLPPRGTGPLFPR
jgi:hypothetical protein